MYGCAEISGNLEHAQVEALLEGGVIRVQRDVAKRAKGETLLEYRLKVERLSRQLEGREGHSDTHGTVRH